MRDSLVFRGSAIWNVVNCNDKIDNLNFKEIKRLFTTKNIVFMATSCVNSLLIMYAGVQRWNWNTNGFNLRITISLTYAWPALTVMEVKQYNHHLRTKCNIVACLTSSTTLCMWSSSLVYSIVWGSLRYVQRTAVLAWHAWAITAPVGHDNSLKRSPLTITYWTSWEDIEITRRRSHESCKEVVIDNSVNWTLLMFISKNATFRLDKIWIQMSFG